MPLSMVLDVPPLDLQGVGGRARPTEGTGHLYILTAMCRDVMWDLCKQCCNREREMVLRCPQNDRNIISQRAL